MRMMKKEEGTFIVKYKESLENATDHQQTFLGDRTRLQRLFGKVPAEIIVTIAVSK